MAGVRVARLRGIPLEMRYSFFVLLLCAYYGGILMGLGANAVFVLLIGCASVLIHEIAHAVVARRLGLPVIAIILHAFGGETRMAGPPRRARDEVLIALAGPLASLLLSGIAAIWLWRSGSIWAELVAAMNLLLAAVNMIPALPLDGGRIVRGLLTPIHGARRATQLMVTVSRAVAIIALGSCILAKVWIGVPLSLLLLLGAGRELAAFDRWASGPTGSVEVLDADGQPAGKRAAALGSTFIIEEHRSALGKRWIVRDLGGTILLETDTPLSNEATRVDDAPPSSPMVCVA